MWSNKNVEEKPTINQIALSTNCSKCNNNFLVKFSRKTGKYSQKNNWGYWTDKVTDQGKYVCSPCLKEMYYRDFLNFKKEVTNPKKMMVFRTYLNTKNL